MLRPTAAVLVLALAQSGCSLMFVDRVPDDYQVSEAPRCSTSSGGVALDVVFAILWGVGGLALLANDGGEASLLPISVAGLHGLSARAGNGRINRCEKWQDEHDDWLARQAAPQDSIALEAPTIRPGNRGGSCLPDGTCTGALVCDSGIDRCMRAADLPGPKREPKADDPPPVASDGQVKAEPPPASSRETTSQPAAREPKRDRRAHARWSEFWREVP